MSQRILGLHHITAIAGEAQRNYDFYTKALGLRLVKKTVNFDDPGTYHFYYGNETGTPGTILTFFPWRNVRQGRIGTGMATEIGYSVPRESLGFWQERLGRFETVTENISERFGETLLPLQDPDGLKLNLIVASQTDNRTAWKTDEIGDGEGIRGFHSILLTVRDVKPTASILTDIFGYTLLKQEGNFYRFVTDAVDNAAIVDILEDKDGKPGHVAGGTNHHVAFRVKDEEVLMNFRDKISARGYQITPKIDRNYFFSLYFREPGGVLFEVATDNPGFAIDEPVKELGLNLKLPVQYEAQRGEIERVLPVLQQ
jgi:glyoxalase family protein